MAHATIYGLAYMQYLNIYSFDTSPVKSREADREGSRGRVRRATNGKLARGRAHDVKIRDEATMKRWNTRRGVLSIVAMLCVAAPTVGWAQEFDPDNFAGKVYAQDLATKFGPIPRPAMSFTVGSVVKNLANEAWAQMTRGQKTIAAKYGVKVDMQATTTETDTAAQLAIAETMVGKGYKIMVMSPITNVNLAPAVDKAKKAGIPVVNMNDAQIANADVFVGGNQKDLGAMAAAYMGEKLGGSGKVVLLEGVAGAYSAMQRKAGFLETMKAKYPGIEVVATVPADYERQKAMDATANLLNQHPDIQGIFGSNDLEALGAVEAVKNAGKIGKVVIIGVDGISAAYDSIKHGEMTATADQFLEKVGETTMEVALRIAAGQKVPRVVATFQTVVDKDTMAKFGRM